MRFIPFLSELIKAILPLVFALVIGATSVAPEDAASNLSKWAHAIGFDRLPVWFVERSADNYVIIITGVCIVIYFAWIISLWQRKAPFWELALWLWVAYFGVLAILF